MAIVRVGQLEYDLETYTGRYGCVWAALKSIGAPGYVFRRAEREWLRLGSPWGR
jgi:hypothetical protein